MSSAHVARIAPPRKPLSLFSSKVQLADTSRVGDYGLPDGAVLTVIPLDSEAEAGAGDSHVGGGAAAPLDYASLHALLQQAHAASL